MYISNSNGDFLGNLSTIAAVPHSSPICTVNWEYVVKFILLADKSCVCYIFIFFSLFKAYYSFNWYLIFNTSRENFLLPPLSGFGFFFLISLRHSKPSFTQQSLFDDLPCASHEKWHSIFKNFLRQNIQFFWILKISNIFLAFPNAS